MSKRFYNTTDYTRLAAMDDESAVDLISAMIERGILLVAERAGKMIGFVAMLVVPFVFNRGKTLASEIAWWVEPEARNGSVAIRLKAAMEQACRDHGCDAIQGMVLATSPPVAARAYERSGYRCSETCFTKEL